ncbi:hypothetical protein SUDANB145_00478 [Streptomyces sp. enrichment culture]|uniref:LysR substrate-binding domain-containing protein n=1 Tax=Streptomyces sp. enrichment culture TaxID=1795815 RepID=UPI003F558CB4
MKHRTQAPQDAVRAAGPSPRSRRPTRRSVLVAAPAWAERVAGADEVGAALRAVPMVTYAEDLPVLRRYWRTVFGRQLAADAAVTVPDLYAVLAAVNSGAGYSVLPRSLCREHLDSGRLVPLRSPAEPPLDTRFLVQRPGADADPDVRRVRDHLRRAAVDWRPAATGSAKAPAGAGARGGGGPVSGRSPGGA